MIRGHIIYPLIKFNSKCQFLRPSSKWKFKSEATQLQTALKTQCQNQSIKKGGIN